MWEYDDGDRPPTANELLRWEADCRGEGRPDVEWILTDYDVWMRNPHYTGVKTEGHPDDHDRDESCVGHMCGPTEPSYEENWWGNPAKEEVGDDEIPF